METAELRQKKPEELEALILELLREQFNLRMQKGSGQLSKPSEMKRVRKEIARAKTIIHATQCNITTPNKQNPHNMNTFKQTKRHTNTQYRGQTITHTRIPGHKHFSNVSSVKCTLETQIMEEGKICGAIMSSALIMSNVTCAASKAGQTSGTIPMPQGSPL